MKMGMSREDICNKSGITSATYAQLYTQYEAMNIDALTTEVIDTWEMLLRAKMMNVTEKSIDVLSEELEGRPEVNTKGDPVFEEDGTRRIKRDMKSAKMAAEVFQTLFSSFRLSTGQSTENTESTVTKFNEVIESKRKLKKPNQSLREFNASAN